LKATTTVHDTLLLIDLARLKVINETLGYPTGDTLIKELALRTRGVVDAAAQSGLAEFVPFAEQTGYITLVTQWTLRVAMRTLQAWQPTHPDSQLRST
jgi:predicted signal transduction protein with EAL and GGDEF domain